MGSQISSFAQSNNLSIPENCKLYSVLPINAPSQQQQMTQILQKRIKLSQCPYICTIKGYDFLAQQSNRLSCTQDKKLVVYYDYFDYRLIDVTIKNYNKEFNQGQLCFIIKCITQALAYLKKFKLHHGDVSFQNICRKGKGWKLIDKIFLKNGINAYEKVLQGETGFISPKHMMRIRHGFIKQSPEISQQDDIFSLGMVILQLASGVPSTLCYKQLNVRFNDEIINNNIQICRKKYSEEFMRIVQGMINFEQEERIGIQAILNKPLIQGKTLFINQYNNLNPIHNVINQAPDTRQAVHFKNSADSSHISYSRTNLIPGNKNYNQQSRKPYTPGSTTVRLMEKPQNDGQLNSNTPRATVGSFKGSQFSQPVHNGKEHMLTRVINSNGTGQTIKAPYYQKFVPLPNSISQPYHNGNVQEGNISNMGGQRLKTIN